MRYPFLNALRVRFSFLFTVLDERVEYRDLILIDGVMDPLRTLLRTKDLDTLQLASALLQTLSAKKPNGKRKLTCATHFFQ